MRYAIADTLSGIHQFLLRWRQCSAPGRARWEKILARTINHLFRIIKSDLVPEQIQQRIQVSCSDVLDQGLSCLRTNLYTLAWLVPELSPASWQ